MQFLLGGVEGRLKMFSIVLMRIRFFQTKGKFITISKMENVKQAKGFECFRYTRIASTHHDIILPLTRVTFGPSISLPTQQTFRSLTYVMFMLPIWRNGPLTSPCPWYFCAMHAIPPCPLIVMTTNLFALRHHFVFHYCACFALCIAQSYNVSFHHISTHLLPLSNAFTIALILLQHLHRWLITTIKYNLCKCFYNTWSKYVHCPIWRSCIACSLLVEITCY